jgi:hypothetical protein
MADTKVTAGITGAAALVAGALIGGSMDGQSAADMEAKWISEAKAIAVAEVVQPEKVLYTDAKTGEPIDAKDVAEKPAEDVRADTTPAVLLPAFSKFVADSAARPGDSIVVIVRSATKDTTLAIQSLSNRYGGVVVVKAQVGTQEAAPKE